MRAEWIVVALLAVWVQRIEGTTWKVGDSEGWQLNVDYTQWTQGKVFEVGDFLLFTYNKSKENVLEVSPGDYATCTTIEPIANYTDGNTTILLGNHTTRFFISGIPGHCVAGMALQINIGSPSPSPSPTPATASSPLLAPLAPPIASPSFLASPPSLQPAQSPHSSTPPSLDGLCFAAISAIALGAVLVL